MKLPETLGKMTEGIRQLAYTYTIAYIDCHQQKVKANKERFEYLLEQLEVAQEKRGWWNWIKERWYASKKEDVEAYLKNCEEVFQLRREVAELYELVNSWEDLQQRYREIKSIWDAYWETLGGKDNIASYEGGKLFIFVASALVPGLGQLSKAKRVKAILEELKGFTKGQWDELVARVRSGLGGVGRLLDDALIAELKATGTAFDESKLIGLIKNPEGKIVWLDKGLTKAEALAISSSRKPAGFAHVVEEHGADFLNKGISEAELPEFLLKAAKENNIVDKIGATSRPVFETTFKGVKQRVTITIGDNGYIVGANPISF